MRVLGVSGSLRRDSHNAALLRAAAPLLPPEAELELYAGLKAVPPYDADDDHEPLPEPVRDLRAAIVDADAIVFATPEYNGSLPGALKNAIDWVSRPAGASVLRNKPVAVIGASTGMFGAVWSQAELRKSLGIIGARVLDRELPVPFADEQFDADGRLVERDLELALAGILAELVAEVPAPVATAAR